MFIMCVYLVYKLYLVMDQMEWYCNDHYQSAIQQLIVDLNTHQQLSSDKRFLHIECCSNWTFLRKILARFAIFVYWLNESLLCGEQNWYSVTQCKILSNSEESSIYWWKSWFTAGSQFQEKICDFDTTKY